MAWDGRVCLEAPLRRIGEAARRAGPPVVAASSIGSWHWCSLKAWHATTLFNAGWLRVEELSREELEGLAMLWAAELAKKGMPRVLHGRILHGDPVDPAEVGEAAKLARLLAGEGGEALLKLSREGRLPSPGLIPPGLYEEQLRRYREAADLLEYMRRWDWPMIAREASGFTVIGVPDRVEEAPGGYRVVELKTTSRPWAARRRLRSYQAAKAQLAAYAWILVERWPIEEAVLVFEDNTGRVVLRERFDPELLSKWFEEKMLPVARALASREPPEPRGRPPCRSCEYGGQWPGR